MGRMALLPLMAVWWVGCSTVGPDSATDSSERDTDSGPGASADTDSGTATDGGPDYTVAGLDARPPQGPCVAPQAPVDAVDVPMDFEPMFVGLELRDTTMIVQHPVDDERFYIVRQGQWDFDATDGSVSVITRDGSGWQIEPILHLDPLVETAVPGSPGLQRIWEGGVLGLAIHPQFASGSPYLYVSYTRAYSGADPEMLLEEAVVRITVDASDQLVPGSVQDVIVLPQPDLNHQGGHLMFGQDGMLYIGFGDGGDDPALVARALAQDASNLYGSIARIDVDVGVPYGIPADNPFVGNSEGWLEEIYATGFRNPWKFDQRPSDGAIWVGDVGLNDWEEIDVLVAGGNYGWPAMHGPVCSNGPCDGTYVDPLLAVRHQANGGDFRALIGGAFWDSATEPAWIGRWFFANQSDPAAFYMLDDQTVTPPVPVLLDSGRFGRFFGVISLRDGRLVALAEQPQRVVPGEAPTPTAPFPQTLAETGCFDAVTLEPVPGLLPFSVNMELWSDGASKRRWMVVPDGQALAYDAHGDLAFPPGSLLFKEFALAGRRLETRMLVHHEDGWWQGYTYRFDEVGTQARLLPGQVVEDVAGVPWLYPSRAQCAGCHQPDAGHALGPDLRQLDSFVDYPGGRRAHQLVTLDAIGILDGLPFDPAVTRGFPTLDDASTPPSTRARAYLHANCSHCHHPNGFSPQGLDLRARNDLPQTYTCGLLPRGSLLGLDQAALIWPGDPERSVVYLRTESTDPTLRMPQLGSSVPHPQWLAVGAAWIEDVTADCRGADADGDGVLDTEDACPLDPDGHLIEDCP